MTLATCLDPRCGHPYSDHGPSPVGGCDRCGCRSVVWPKLVLRCGEWTFRAQRRRWRERQRTVETLALPRVPDRWEDVA